MKKVKYILAWFCLLAGGCIYILFRSRQHLGFIVADALGLGSIIDNLRACVAETEVPEFVRFSLPDGLWSMSYILMMDYIFRNENIRSRVLWASIIPFLGIFSEFLQFVGWLPGVFDPLDIAAYCLPYVLYVMAQLRFVNKK